MIPFLRKIHQNLISEGKTVKFRTMKNLNHSIYALILIITAAVTGCQPAKKLSPGEGYVDVTGGKVWYRIVGSGDKTPLLLLHGGPGFTSYYLNPMADLGKDRPVIFFDQLGCGRSASDVDSTMMTIENYVEQVEQLRTSLGIEDLYLYGHSWGTMLGMDYYLKYPKNIKAMILASPALSAPRWSEDAKELIATLPDSIQSAIQAAADSNAYDTPEYEHAVNVFYEKFVIRKLPWDANIDSTFEQANLNVYGYMWGPSEFTATGTLADYDRTDVLGQVNIPTLYVCGEFDEARPSTLEYFQSLTPGSKIAVIENAAHVTMHDNPKRNNEVIRNFLQELEKKNSLH